MANRKTTTDHPEDQNPAAPQAEVAETTLTTSTADDAAIADSAIVRDYHDDELEGEQEQEFDEDGKPVEPEPDPEFLTKDEFRAMFISLHDAPAMLDPDAAVFSIPEPSGHMLHDMRYEGACQVADRLYDRCAAQNAPEWLKSLIRADKKAWSAWAGIAAYGFGFVIAAREFKHIKLARAHMAQQAANNPEPPQDEADAA